MDDRPQYLMIRSDELLRRDAEIDRLRAQLERTTNLATHDYMNGQAELSAVRAELAEARRALLAGNDTVLENKKLQERIAHERVEGDKILAALEMANARIAELEATRLHLTGEVARLTQNSCDDQDRAERAEAECKALRETVRKIRATDNITAVWHIADAALTPSRAGREG